ncbi:UDP-glycosyltransferase 73B4-like [Henckelia pumila]|uniref:UDP-glycosyltransferase 73B4-like n=1 Tax=Henckelia pumila TaxID=405737 RepID=UPI003C6E9F79
MGLPVLGVGPLLPNQFWASSNSMVHDVLIRQPKHQSNYSEAQILQWLNKNPEKSVLYLSFGSEVSLTIEESMQLTSALQEMPYPFIWVARKNSNDIDLGNNVVSNAIRDVKGQIRNEWDFLDELRVGIWGRGLIISGWAPQLLILSHPSTGGFMSHCGWNSTLEAMARGGPIRGDQIYNVKLVVNHLKVGHMVVALNRVTPKLPNSIR